jgi:hypothetical protein
MMAAPAERPAAFILLGGLRVVLRNWLYLTELDRRGLKILLITSDNWRQETLACMRDEQSPGRLISDSAFVAGDIRIEGHFTAGVTEHVRAWQRRFDIVGVFAAGEVLVEQTGLVADALGLRSPGLRATRVCRSKYLQRLYLAEWSPRAVVIPSDQRGAPRLDSVGFPAVLKPSSRRSSSGVREIADSAGLLAALERYPPGETLLVEEYVTGPEFSVESLIRDGRVCFASVTAKVTNEARSDSFVELGHTVPAPTGQMTSSILELNRAVAARLEFADGVMHSEFKVAPGGEVKLMEVAARTPGDGLLPLYHLATGTPMEPEIIKIALGEAGTYPPPHRFARQVYVEAGTGVLEDVKLRWPGIDMAWAPDGSLWPAVAPVAADAPPGLRAAIVLKQRGSRLGPLRESDDRAFTFLVDAPSLGELDRVEARVRASLDISLRT